MKATKAQERALVSLLTRIYSEIMGVENAWGIRGDGDDYRARIEYFHDAVRAFTESGGRGSELKDRLSVEMLAYDVSMLRYIQAHPLPGLKDKKKLSPGTQVAESSLPRAPGDRAGLKPDSGVRYQLSDLYKSYSVLFAALLSEPADRNYASRLNESNAEIEDIYSFLRVVEAGAPPGGEIDLDKLAAQHLDNAEALQKLLAAMQGGKLKKRLQVAEAARHVKAMAQAADKEAKAIEQAHFTYATSQLAIYEGARDVIKKMAGKGFNIVGDFVENAVRDAMRGDRSL